MVAAPASANQQTLKENAAIPRMTARMESETDRAVHAPRDVISRGMRNGNGNGGQIIRAVQQKRDHALASIHEPPLRISSVSSIVAILQ